jgi:hypothetical protein
VWVEVVVSDDDGKQPIICSILWAWLSKALGMAAIEPQLRNLVLLAGRRLAMCTKASLLPSGSRKYAP